jgi:hypothetical protein
MDLMSWIVSLGHWNWFIAAVALFVLEILAPGSFMMWLGLAALVVGGISLAVDWSWQAQLIAFGVLSVAAIPAWRHFAPKVERPVDRRTSTGAPKATSGACSRSISRSSMASAPSASTTQSGGSPAPTARPAAGCGSRAPRALI